jgi:hypothetical protein
LDSKIFVLFSESATEVSKEDENTTYQQNTETVCLVEYLIGPEVQGRWKGVQHLLLSYVFARQLWFTFLLSVGLHDLAPQVSTTGGRNLL